MVSFPNLLAFALVAVANSRKISPKEVQRREQRKRERAEGLRGPAAEQALQDTARTQASPALRLETQRAELEERLAELETRGAALAAETARVEHGLADVLEALDASGEARGAPPAAAPAACAAPPAGGNATVVRFGAVDESGLRVAGRGWGRDHDGLWPAGELLGNARLAELWRARPPRAAASTATRRAARAFVAGAAHAAVLALVRRAERGDGAVVPDWAPGNGALSSPGELAELAACSLGMARATSPPTPTPRGARAPSYEHMGSARVSFTTIDVEKDKFNELICAGDGESRAYAAPRAELEDAREARRCWRAGHRVELRGRALVSLYFWSTYDRYSIRPAYVAQAAIMCGGNALFAAVCLADLGASTTFYGLPPRGSSWASRRARCTTRTSRSWATRRRSTACATSPCTSRSSASASRARARDLELVPRAVAEALGSAALEESLSAVVMAAWGACVLAAVAARLPDDAALEAAYGRPAASGLDDDDKGRAPALGLFGLDGRDSLLGEIFLGNLLRIYQRLGWEAAGQYAFAVRAGAADPGTALDRLEFVEGLAIGALFTLARRRAR
ncbi:hypothetical protein SO694_00041233 [Aureococcus anophagefferens]|uniref:Uncharacterized protein n=1 Tax=Aureococcus anophagefferens TaxID=44056 RepID=A0ABR1G6J6_AURAN